MGDKYEYLNMIAMLYEMGNWDETTVRKRVSEFAKENEVPEEAINDFLSRVIKKKEHTIEEKRSFLSKVAFSSGEPKYGDAVNVMNDAMVEKYYDMESKAMGVEATEKLHSTLATPEVRVEPEKPKTPTVEPVAEATPVVPKVEPVEVPVVETKGPTVRTVPVEGTVTRGEPTTEEDYERVARSIETPEPDSEVRHVDASPERIERLKKNKSKAKQFFLKAGVVAVTFALASGFSIPLIGGYLIFAHQIKNGTYNIPGKFGQTIRKTVEGIMNLGKSKEEIEAEKAARAAVARARASASVGEAVERGRTR